MNSVRKVLRLLMGKRSLNFNIILTTIKTIASLMFPLVTFPYVSRVLPPAGIGEYNYSNSIITYFTLIAGLGINTYAIREGTKIREKKDTFNAFANEIFSLNIISTLASYMILFVCFMFLQEFQNHKVSLMIFSTLILFKTIGVDWIFSIYEDYFYITVRSLAFQVLSVILLFLFVRTKEDCYAYIAINVLSNVGTNIFNLVYSRRYFKIRLSFSKQIWKHLIPVLIIFSTTLSTMIYVNSDTTMLGWLCGTEQVGYYSVASKMYNIIKSTLNAIVPVFMTRLSFQYDNAQIEYKRTFSYAFNLLTFITIPLAIGALFYSDTIILLLSGEEYLQASNGMKMLFVSLFFASLGNLYSSGGILQAKKEKRMLFATGIGACINILANFFFIPLYGCTGASFTTLITEIIVFSILYFCYKKYVGCSVGISHIINCSLGTVPFILIFVLGRYLFPNSVVAQVVQIAISSIAYIAVLFYLKDDIAQGLIKKGIQTVQKRFRR